MGKQLWKIWCEKDVGHLANQLIQLFQILARSGIRFWKARPELLQLLVQILAADFWNRILLGSPFGSDSAARQRNLSIKTEPNRAFDWWAFGQLSHGREACEVTSPQICQGCHPTLFIPFFYWDHGLLLYRCPHHLLALTINFSSLHQQHVPSFDDVLKSIEHQSQRTANKCMKKMVSISPTHGV